MNRSRALGVDLPITQEEALALEISRSQGEASLAENREAIQAYNEHVEQNGVFAILRARFESGDIDVAARHDEHQP